MPDPKMDRLTSQLASLPSIVGNLGISVANAQKLLNADYVDSVRQIVAMIGSFLKPMAAGEEVATETLQKLIGQLAPSRYQFTETTLEFSADLSERKDQSIQGAFGGGFGAVTISAGMAQAFGYDYRAAARVSTVLHAITPDPEVFNTLLNRAKEIAATPASLPDKTEADEVVFERVGKLLDSVKKPA